MKENKNPNAHGDMNTKINEWIRNCSRRPTNKYKNYKAKVDISWEWKYLHSVKVKVAQSCLTLCNPMDYRLPSSPAHGDFPSKNTGIGCHALLQGIFPSQESNSGLPHCCGFFTIWATRKPMNTGVGGLSLLHGIFLTQESNWGLLHCRWILHQLSYQGSI